jgi:hypothetical protein
MAMASASRLIRVLTTVLALAAFAGAGCRSTTSQTVPTTTAPQVNSISPSSVLGTGDVKLHFIGSNFSSGMFVKVTSPSGVVSLVAAPNLTGLTSGAFDMTLTASETGVYTFVLQNPDGNLSASALFPVQATADSPIVQTVTPNIPVSSPQLQTLLVTGLSFDDALTVRLLDPTGFTVNTAVVGFVQPTQFQVSTTLSKKGVYQMSVINPSGAISNTVSVTVQ